MATKKPKNTEQSPSPPLALWNYYRVTWHFLTNLCSSVPADPALVQKWLDARKPTVRAPGARSIQEINEEVLATLERAEGDMEQVSMLVFQRIQGVLSMRAATVKAHIKDCARVLSAQFIGRIEGERAFSTRVMNGVYLDESTYWLPVCRTNGEAVTQADGVKDKPISVPTPRGRMSALKCFEYIEPPATLVFTLKVLGKSVSQKDLDHIFEYGGVHGYAGERGDGEGRYHYEIERLDA